MKKKPSCDMLGSVFDDMDDVCSSVMSDDVPFLEETDDDEPNVIGMDHMTDLHVTDDEGHVDGNWPKTDNPPLLDIFIAMVRVLSTAALLKLTENWGILSLLTVVGVGSGCTGSGLDYYAIKLMAEVLA